uniref:Uncharacterized protein n=1 Tax=Arion vulgaris TaxID=1028688 RepID=A0A0B7B6Y0_9EUPU
MTTMEDLRVHLVNFVPEYPVKKGYVAQLLLDRCRLTDVIKKVKDLVLATDIDKDKCIDDVHLKNNVTRFDKLLRLKMRCVSRQWSSIMDLCLEIFPVRFKNMSSSVVLQSVISTASPSVSGTPLRSPSPKRLRCNCRCESCANTQRTFVNMKKKCNSLQRKITDIRKQRSERLVKYSVQRVNLNMKRKMATIDALKKKYKESCVRKSVVDNLRDSLRVAREKRDNLDAMVREHMSTVESLQKKLKEAEKIIGKLAIEREENNRRHKAEILLAGKKLHNDCSYYANELAMTLNNNTCLHCRIVAARYSNT